MNLPKRSAIVQIRLADVRWRNQSLARGLVPTTGSRIMYVKGENMNDGEVKKYYISEITEMISKINDAGTLEYLHTFIKLFLKKWG